MKLAGQADFPCLRHITVAESQAGPELLASLGQGSRLRPPLAVVLATAALAGKAVLADPDLVDLEGLPGAEELSAA